jgi:hypothetical protein
VTLGPSGKHTNHYTAEATSNTGTYILRKGGGEVAYVAVMNAASEPLRSDGRMVSGLQVTKFYVIQYPN